MKKIFKLLVLLLLVTPVIASAQILTPVHWSYAAKKVSKTEAIVFIKATIDNGWHIYSQHIEDGGPVKTTIAFPKSKLYTLIGSVIEPKPVSHFEKSFNMKVSFFEQSVIFQQKIKLLSKSPVNVKGKVEFMVCNDEKCLPPTEVAFNVLIK